MGIFDLFGRDSKSKQTENVRGGFATDSGMENKVNNPISVFSPTSYEDVETIINALKSGKSAMVHLNSLKTETAVRVLDMLSGAIFALGGGLYEMEKNIFMFSPTGIEIGK